MNEEPDIVYEDPPRVSELNGNESEADAATFAAACALLRRYTSRDCIAEAAALLYAFVDAFENWPQARHRLGAQTLGEWGQDLRERRKACERGLALLEAGHTAAAYAAILLAMDGMEPDDPRDERHLSLSLLTDELGAAMTNTGETLGMLSGRVSSTLSARWTYDRLMADSPPMQEEAPTVATDAPTIASGRTTPKTGIGVPITIRYGCPNVLIAGQPAPLMTRACRRFDYAASDGGGLEPPRPAWSAYEYVEEPAVWRMVWYDTRYRAGVLLA